MKIDVQRDQVDDDMVAELTRVLAEKQFLVALTGAGISVASGLPLLTESIDGQFIESLFNQDVFRTDAVAYYQMYRKIMLSWRSVCPNPAHLVLARRGVWVVTLNIDGLHRDAGTERLIEMHGNLRELRCTTCHSIYDSQLVWREVLPRCPGCNRVLWPGFSFRGEEIRHYSLAADWCGRAEAMLVVGTQLHDAPANLLPDMLHDRGQYVIYINEEAENWIPRLIT